MAPLQYIHNFLLPAFLRARVNKMWLLYFFCYTMASAGNQEILYFCACSCASLGLEIFSICAFSFCVAQLLKGDGAADKKSVSHSEQVYFRHISCGQRAREPQNPAGAQMQQALTKRRTNRERRRRRRRLLLQSSFALNLQVFALRGADANARRRRNEIGFSACCLGTLTHVQPASQNC